MMDRTTTLSPKFCTARIPEGVARLDDQARNGKICQERKGSGSMNVLADCRQYFHFKLLYRYKKSIWTYCRSSGQNGIGKLQVCERLTLGEESVNPPFRPQISRYP